MGQLDSILDIFFENPSKNFQIRGIAKLLKIPKTTVSYNVNALLKRKLIIKEKKGVFPSFRANETNSLFKVYKQHSMILKIYQSGLVDYLEKKTLPRCIILFGSIRKGEYDARSDIDIFVQSSEQTLDLVKFEKKLGHKINALFEPELKDLSEELLNNIINGIVLYGSLRVKWKEI
jgi:predicted nucleotidyltransferase